LVIGQQKIFDLTTTFPCQTRESVYSEQVQQAWGESMSEKCFCEASVYGCEQDCSAIKDQPNGGVGASGMGSYHGEWGFRTFSKEKPLFIQSRFAGTKLFQPPYGATFERLLSLLKKII
jgi:hypothetical protein